MKPTDDLLLADVMQPRVFTVAADAPLGALVERMRAAPATHAVVLDGTAPVGMLTERDLVRLLHRQVDCARCVREAMSAPVVVVPETLGFKAAYVQLCLSRLRHLIAVDAAGKIVGVAGEHDFLAHLVLELFRSVGSIERLIDSSAPQLAGDTPVDAAIDLMVREKRGCIAVVDRGRLLGMFTEREAAHALARQSDGQPVLLRSAVQTDACRIAASATVAEVIAQLVASNNGYLLAIGADGAVVGAIEQARLLENLRAAIHAEIAAHQLAETANSVPAATLAKLTQEIRGPLADIADLNLALQAGAPTPAQAAQLKKIEVACRRLLSVVDGIPVAPVQRAEVPPPMPATAPPGAATSLDALRRLPGIDVDRGLMFLGGKHDKYLKLLNHFFQTHAEDAALLESHLAAGEQIAAQRVAHSLKGAASTLGLVEMADIATRLDACLKREQALSDRAGEVRALTDELVAAWSALLKAWADANRPSGARDSPC